MRKTPHEPKLVQKRTAAVERPVLAQRKMWFIAVLGVPPLKM